MARVARVMAMATKRAIATDGNNMGNGYGKEASGQATVATMAIGMGTAQRTWPLMLFTTGERGMMVVMGHGLCVSFVCVERPQKIRSDLKKVNASWSL